MCGELLGRAADGFHTERIEAFLHVGRAQHFHQQMSRRAAAARSLVDLPRLCPGQRDHVVHRLRDNFRAEVATRARTIVYHHLLAEVCRQALREQARHHIDRAAAKRSHKTYRPPRKIRAVRFMSTPHRR